MKPRKTRTLCLRVSTALPDFTSLSSAISIVLGVLTYFLTMAHTASTALLKETIPPEAQVAARRKLRNRLWQVLLWAVLPIFLALTGLFYLCLPTTITVLRISGFQPWAFELDMTLFVYLEIAIAACAIVTGVMGIRLLIKLVHTWSEDEPATIGR
jgi:hypothetical protein